MDDLFGSMQKILSDPESMQQLQELAQLLKEDDDGSNNNDSNISANNNNASRQSSDSNTIEEPSAKDAGGLGLDIGSLMKVSQLMGSSERNDDTALLLALKPHLKAERQKKVDKAIKLMKMLSIWSLLKESGMLKDFTL